jgi:hypoxanthine phosphoribosyltransferase
MNVSKYPVDKFKDKTIVITEDFLYNKNNLQFSKMHYQYIDKVILSRGAIVDRIEKLAENIVKDYIDKTVYFLVVLKGAIVFGTQLAEHINNILKNDITNSYNMKYYFEYISISSYENDKSTGNVKIKADEDLFEKLRGQHIVIVEDIYDSGTSLCALMKELNELNPLSLRSTILFQKTNPKHLEIDYEVEYLGFLIPDLFVIGFGLDYNEQFRQLNHLVTINQKGIDAFKLNQS